MRKFLYTVLDYLFEHKKAREAVYYILVGGLVLCVLGLDAWRIAAILVLSALLHAHGLVDGSRTAFDAAMKERT